MKYFYLKQKVFSLRNAYTIYDDQKTELYYAKSKFLVSRKLTLYESTTDNILYTMERKRFSFRPSYTISDSNGTNVASTKKQRALFKQKVNVDSAHGQLVIEGNYRAHDFTIKHENGKDLASIHKKRLAWGDTYEIVIYADDHETFYLALVLLIDSKYHEKRKRSNTRRSRINR